MQEAGKCLGGRGEGAPGIEPGAAISRSQRNQHPSSAAQNHESVS
jgi:hypothetical protein